MNSRVGTFEELRSIGDGWLDGEGFAPRCLDLVEAWFVENDGLFDSFPPVFPQSNGGVVAEWRTSKYYLSIEFAPDFSHVYANSLSLGDSCCVDEVFMMNEEGAMDLVAWLRAFNSKS